MNQSQVKFRTSTNSDHLCIIQITNYRANLQQECQKGRNHQIYQQMKASHSDSNIDAK